MRKARVVRWRKLADGTIVRVPRRYVDANGKVWDVQGWVDLDNLTPTERTVSVSRPTSGETVATVAVQVRAAAAFATGVVASIGSLSSVLEQRESGGWTGSVAGVANGARSLVVTATFEGGVTASATVPFTMAYTEPPPVEPGPVTEAVWFHSPDMSVDDPFITGTAWTPLVKVDPTRAAEHGGVKTIEFQYGSLADVPFQPQFGWREMVSTTADGGGWVLPEGQRIDTRTYGIRAREVNNPEVTTDGPNPPARMLTEQDRQNTSTDYFWDCGIRATFGDGTVEYGKRIRVISNSRTPERRVGVTPSFKSAFTYTAEYSNDPKYDNDPMERRRRYLARLKASSPTGVRGSLNGKEPSAFSIVPDPVPTGVDGHINHGNVFEAHVPLNYHEITANKDSYWKPYGLGDTYDEDGDQPNKSYRSQMVYPGRLQEGDMVYIGRAIRFPPDFPTPSKHLSIGQFYQKDFEWGLAMMLETKWDGTGHGEPDQADHAKFWGERMSPFERGELFRIPFLRGQWFDLMWGIGVSRDARVGWLELYTRRPDVQAGKLIQHTWPDGSKRLRIALLQEGNVSGGGGISLHDHIYWSRTLFPGYGKSSATPARIMYAKQKVRGTLAEVDPKSYNPA